MNTAEIAQSIIKKFVRSYDMLLALFAILLNVILAFCSTWWPRRQRCTSGVLLPLLTTVAWEGAETEVEWACPRGVAPEARIPVEMSNRTNASSAWKPFHPIINWYSTYGCTLGRNLINVHIVTEGLNNCPMCNNIQDYILVSPLNILSKKCLESFDCLYRNVDGLIGCYKMNKFLSRQSKNSMHKCVKKSINF